MAAYVFSAYWPHPSILLTSNFHPSAFSLADWTEVSDVSPDTSQTFVLHVSPMWVQQPWDGLMFVPVSWQPKFLSSFLPLTQTFICTHTHTLRGIRLPSLSQFVICAKALGEVGGVSAVIWWRWGGPKAWSFLTLILSLLPSQKSSHVLSLQLWRMSSYSSPQARHLFAL